MSNLRLLADALRSNRYDPETALYHAMCDVYHRETKEGHWIKGRFILSNHSPSRSELLLDLPPVEVRVYFNLSVREILACSHEISQGLSLKELADHLEMGILK